MMIQFRADLDFKKISRDLVLIQSSLLKDEEKIFQKKSFGGFFLKKNQDRNFLTKEKNDKFIGSQKFVLHEKLLIFFENQSTIHIRFKSEKLSNYNIYNKKSYLHNNQSNRQDNSTQIHIQRFST